MKRTTEETGITIKHATIKHAETIGMTERTHQELKTILKINISADQRQWDQDVNIAVMAHNTTYHNSVKCASTEIFHGRTPHSALDLKFAIPIGVTTQPTDVSKMLYEVNEQYKQNVHNIVTAYHKHKTFFDRKAIGEPLKVNEYVSLLNPQYENQRSKEHFEPFHWQRPYKLLKILSDSNYVFRKTGSIKAQWVHRMRLRPFVPQDEIKGIQII